MQDFLCGLAAGWAQIVSGQPLDYIKVKIQANPQLKATPTLIAKQIYAEHGLFGFYRGSSSLFFGFAFTIATEFLLYESAKRFISKWVHSDPVAELGIAHIGAAGALVGFVVSFIYCPIEYTKIQRQITKNINQNSLSLLFKEISESGTKKIFQGLNATLLRETIGSLLYFTTYEQSVRILSKHKRQEAKPIHFMLSGAISGLIFWLIMYPIDCVKTSLQLKKTLSESLQALRLTRLRGYNIVLLRSMIVNSSSFFIYEQCHKLSHLLASPYYSMY